MILWHQKISRSQDIMKAVINQLYKENINTDGVVEVFNNGIEQGCVLKLFDKYNPKLDLCIWVYMPNDRTFNNQYKVLIGKHIDCNEINMWNNEELKSYVFEDAKIREAHNKTRNFLLNKVRKTLERTHNLPSL